VKSKMGYATLLVCACTPGAALLLLHHVLGAKFGHEPVVDPICHFSGGAAAAYGLLVCVENTFWFGQPSRWAEILLAIGCAALAALAWELAELGSDFAFGTRIQINARNTLRDLALGACGGAALACWPRKHRA
jgi:hypothetical protein